MEIDKTQEKSVEASEDYDLIKVRALITCPNSDFNKTFRNQFLRKDLELLEVSLKCFSWLTCAKCGELLDLNLEFKI
ncbi:hypothetical protein LCGC14_1264550 [marine sediment metagenome]|uniref:Uncharacterized protein n=1 Tax=marine sediment metagenome TaxID=412755 RepID=A0A0F9L245_9ZZZZ